MLKRASTYHLIVELLCDGKAEALPDIEPIEIEEIVRELEERSDQSFGRSAEQWVEWFITSEEFGTEYERRNVALIKRIIDTERRALKRFQEKEQQN